MDDDLVESRHSREPGRRRGPYALRACDACRRRKGKCDGRQPCRHCAARKRACFYSPLPREEVSAADNTQTQAPSQQSSDTAQAAIDAGSGSQHSLDPDANTTVTGLTDIPSLTRMVVQLQQQVEQLAAQVQVSQPPQHANKSIDQADRGTRQSHRRGSSGQAPSSFANPAILGPYPISPPSSRFCGPTSPDFSMNLARVEGDQASLSASPSRYSYLEQPVESLPTTDRLTRDAEDMSPAFHQHASYAAASPLVAATKRSRLLLYRGIMSLPETIRLLQLYRDIMDDLHPLVDVDCVMRNAIELSSGQSQPSPHLDSHDISDNSLMILNLCLLISLRAETNAPVTEVENRLSASLADLMNGKLTAPAVGLQDIVIVILMGMYYFYQDLIHTAWRMCGVAGRLMMELGLHNSEFLRTKAESDREREQAATLQATIMVFDRHWSAAIGLPTNFQDGNFDSIPRGMIYSPYLSAMLSFLSTSDKFADFISSSAQGGCHEDVDAYEVLNLQLEQWRRRCVGAQSISLIRQNMDSQNPASRPPSWALLLALRAEAVRTLLLRPFFFPKTNESASQKKMQLALELVHDLVNIMSALDKRTNLYCVQGPFYHHVLYSATALFYLIMTYVEGKSAAIRAIVSAQAETVATIYQTTLGLSTRYFVSSHASRRLFRRLMDLRSTFDRLGITLSPPPVDNGDSGPAMDNPEIGASSTSKFNAPLVNLDSGNAFADVLAQFSEEQRLLWQRQLNADTVAMDMDASMHMGCAETLLFDWPIEGQELMFSLNELDEHQL